MAHSVLVVDDDPMFRALAARLLASEGLSVIAEAGTVAEALSKAEEFKPSAVLVDLGLPDGDGVALTRELTALSWHPRVVITSLDGELGSREELRRSGAEAFVRKEDLPNAPLAGLFGDDWPPQ